MNESDINYGLDLISFDTYKSSSICIIKNKICDFYSPKNFSQITLNNIKRDINNINAYPEIKQMYEVKHDEIKLIDDDADTSYAEKAILDGKIFFEHAAAGEATRLGIGTKYVIKPNDLHLDRIREILVKEARKDLKSEEDIQKLESIPDEVLLSQCGKRPEDLMQLSLGTRHMIQLIYDIRKLADKHNFDPDEACKRQKMLIILNESSSTQISEEIESHYFYSLDPRNVYFMEQKSFHGINKIGDKLFFDELDAANNPRNNRRLHNHGQMVMQKLHEESIFRIVGNKRIYVERKEFLEMLNECIDMISYNIEDLGYLTSSLDLKSLATALELGKQGYKMVMEVVGQNPLKPQKGASLFKDPKDSRLIMIESFRLADLKNEDLKLMNKNFNHYPDPEYSLRKMAEKGLMVGFEVKTAADGLDYIYPCPTGRSELYRTNCICHKKESQTNIQLEICDTDYAGHKSYARPREPTGLARICK